MTAVSSMKTMESDAMGRHCEVTKMRVLDLASRIFVDALSPGYIHDISVGNRCHKSAWAMVFFGGADALIMLTRVVSPTVFPTVNVGVHGGSGARAKTHSGSDFNCDDII